MFVAAKGVDYRKFLDALHQQLLFDWYLEIGSQTGMSLAKSQSPSIAVDPVFRIRYDIAGNKPHLHLYQQTSDDFFAAGHLKTLKARPDFAFLDGMHLFEYLLRDFMNTEAAAKPTSVIALHDCCPFSHLMTTRDIDNIPRGPWTGDVWKLIPILQEYRPDLTLQVLDCAPTGLVVVTNLDPKSKALTKAYDEILARYTDLSLQAYGVRRFYDSFTYVDAVALANDGFPGFSAAANTVRPADAPLVGPTPSPPAEPLQLEKLTVHNVELYSGHRVLRDFALDLARCVTRPLSQPMDVYVGVQAIDRPAATGRFTLGIQTEHYFDSTGQRMWRVPKERFRARYATYYDLLLDLSPDNIPAYDFLHAELRGKLRFGPHVFPDAPIAPDYRAGAPLFFGALNDRRRIQLDRLLTRRKVEVVPHRTFGRSLDAVIDQHGPILNLHFRDGVYSEYPRFLKAYLRGKPVLSEPLSAPLVAGEHYFDLDAQPSKAQVDKVFGNLAGLSARYSFQTFLEAALADTVLQKVG